MVVHCKRVATAECGRRNATRSFRVVQLVGSELIHLQSIWKLSDNKRKFINCNYEENRSQHEIRTLRSQLESLSNGLSVASGSLPIPLSLDSTTQHYPIPSQWYMPFLVNHCKLFLERVFRWSV